MTDALGPCPRCGFGLTAGVGVLGEAACGSCHARFLDRDVVERVREAWLRIDPELFGDLARAGTRSQPCPRCRTSLRVQRVRGVEVDLCAGCGGMLLDPGELLALSKGLAHEVAAAPASAPARDPWQAGSGLELADKPRGGPALRWVVYCLQCDHELDFNETNYLVNDRPWCSPCTNAHGIAGWGSVLDTAVNVADTAVSALGLFADAVSGVGRRFARALDAASDMAGGGAVSTDYVVERVPPGNPDKFAPHARRARE